MDKHTMRAFEKLQRREHLLRTLNDRLARGVISQEVYEREEYEIYANTQLTEKEKRAYLNHIKIYRRKKG